MAEQYPCIQCSTNVTGRSHAIACDSCGRWNHRKCGTESPINNTYNCDGETSQSHGDVQTVMHSPWRLIEPATTRRQWEMQYPRQWNWTCRRCALSSNQTGAMTENRPIKTIYRGVKAGERQYWRCAIRNKKMICPASVKECMGMFTPGLGGHIHPADPGASQKVKIAKKVKEVAKERIFEPAAAIVERVMREMVTPDNVNLPKPDNLARAANHHRRLRPDDPTNLEFEVDQEFVGHDFILEDIRMNGARHIIFGTKQQIDLLRQAKRWFLDGTFKVVKEPFYQLTTINVFVKRGDDEKQVPLAYILMSRRSKDDYVTILKSLRQHLGQPLVEWFMLDYEAATWQAIREVFLS